MDVGLFPVAPLAMMSLAVCFISFRTNARHCAPFLLEAAAGWTGIVVKGKTKGSTGVGDRGQFLVPQVVYDSSHGDSCSCFRNFILHCCGGRWRNGSSNLGGR